ncbi:hypothetical protein [Erwinia mallotivora]|uniref:hypothetical protein n=1 Tax=Erwinia mallotivora TaxID=69222 RepID=UPI0021BF4C5E|nr:hypothetical protein [Erwinia mallotivora]
MRRTLQQLVDLTPEQLKAWKRFERAFKDFKKAGGKFYTVLETVYGYNGEHIHDVDNDVGHHVQGVSMPSIMDRGLSGFADDWHGFILKDGVEVADDNGGNS